MTRVPRNKGSYTARKGGSYQVKYPLGWSDYKKAYDEYREEVGSEAEAIELIKKINDFVYHGGAPSEVPAWRKGVAATEKTASMTVRQFAEDFVSTRKRQKAVEPRTIQTDKECYARVDPYIGSMPIAAVTAKDIDEAFARMRSTGPDNLNGYAYSGTTLQKTYCFLSMLFDKALDYDLITRNPMTKVPRPRRDTQEKDALSADDAQALFSEIASSPLAPKPVGLLICMGAGLRLSEMLALTWADYKNGILTISKSLARDSQKLKDTKNHEKRSVPCPPPLIAVLDDWKKAQQKWYANKGLRWSEKAPIVQSRSAKHTLQRSFDRWFEQARIGYSIPNDSTVHQLRHTYTTFLSRDCGIDSRTTQSLTGHKSDQAFAIYTHTNAEWQRKAADRLGKIIAPDDESSRCKNCRHWTVSPHDLTKGACWSNEDEGLLITSAADCCRTEHFSMSVDKL